MVVRRSLDEDKDSWVSAIDWELFDRAFLRDTAARSEEYALSLAAEIERLRTLS